MLCSRLGVSLGCGVVAQLIAQGNGVDMVVVNATARLVAHAGIEVKGFRDASESIPDPLSRHGNDPSGCRIRLRVAVRSYENSVEKKTARAIGFLLRDRDRGREREPMDRRAVGRPRGVDHAVGSQPIAHVVAGETGGINVSRGVGVNHALNVGINCGRLLPAAFREA